MYSGTAGRSEQVVLHIAGQQSSQVAGIGRHGLPIADQDTVPVAGVDWQAAGVPVAGVDWQAAGVPVAGVDWQTAGGKRTKSQITKSQMSISQMTKSQNGQK